MSVSASRAISVNDMKLLLAHLLVLFTLTGSLHALGAEAETAATEEEETAAEQPSTDEAATDAAQSDDTADAADNEEARTPPLNPNEPFVPSVQISEDLSVSFPVDI